MVASDLRVFGWGARIRTWECRYQKPMPYHLATPQQAAGCNYQAAGESIDSLICSARQKHNRAVAAFLIILGHVASDPSYQTRGLIVLNLGNSAPI